MTLSGCRVISNDGSAKLFRNFIDIDFHHLDKNIEWQEERLRLFGREVLSPRLVAFYGEPDIHYRYSGKLYIAKPWTEQLMAIHDELNKHLNNMFNAVLLNRYADGKDYIGWHSDDEKEITGDIAILSLGATRDFCFRHKRSKEKISLKLCNGDLLVMDKSLQSSWQHALPKRLRVNSPRVSLSFRQIKGEN